MMDTSCHAQQSSCPKCRSTDILRIPGKIGGPGLNNIVIGLTVFNAVPVTRYLCTGGFEVIGVDPAGGSLDVARPKPGSNRVHWIHGDATE